MKSVSEIRSEFFRKYNMICEGWMASHMITEDRASKNLHKARRYAESRGLDKAQAAETVNAIRHDISNVRLCDYKFLIGVTRMFLDGELRSDGAFSEIDGFLKIIASDAHVDEYDENLNGMTFSQIKDRFSQVAGRLVDTDREKLGNMQFTENSDYQIVRIDSQEDASRYAPYCDWCITTSKSNYDSYTSKGINQVYFCLRNGFENEERTPGEGFPLDSYGLSMISIIVRPNGSLAYGTTRWNHKEFNGVAASDSSIDDTTFMSKLIGRNFYDVFKPNNKFQEAVEVAKERLANGEPPEDIFDACDDDCFDANNGWIKVSLLDMYSFITPDGKLIKDGQLWFDIVWHFREGFASVRRDDGKWSVINARTGDLIKGGQLWFKWAGSFNNGFAQVRREDGKLSFMDARTGDLIKGGQLWFYWVGGFNNGFAQVQRDDGKWSFLDARTVDLIGNGQLWFKNIDPFYEGFANVQCEDGKVYKLDTEGNLYGVK